MKKTFALLVTFAIISSSFFSSGLQTQQLVNSDHLKLDELRTKLYSVPEGGQSTIELPNHMDIWREYKVTESNILAPDFRQRRSDVRTFRIVDKRNPIVRGRLAISQYGMHAIIISPFGTIYIENTGAADSDQYYIYLNDNPLAEEVAELPRPSCLGMEKAPEYREPMRRFNMRSNDVLEFGEVMRTYNLAIVSSGDFYLNNGATIPLVEDAIINSVNAIQAIFETDLGVQFNLLDPHIYTSPAADPFVPPGPSLTKQAADAIHSHFAVSEYDIGHVFHNSTGSTIGGGGVAGLGVVCRDLNWMGGPGKWKGAGWSGSSSNTTNFWIQLAAHEIGHMFNATHTFNGSGGACTGGNFSPTTNYEIGSGTTVMSYQGSCGAGQNIPSSGVGDNYFHANSLVRMIDYILDFGTCADEDDLGNSPPVAEADPCGLINQIPTGTPFKIVGEGTDPDGDVLAFSWEQYDNDGPTGPTQGKIGADAAADPLAPLFRSYPASNTATRYFPSKSLLLNGEFASSFEPLPTVARDLTFRLSVRDGNGGLGMDELFISVEDAGPFELTFPNGGEVFDAGDNINVTWDVNGTNAFCNDVDIYLSIDGGQTFPYQIAEGESNNGSFSVELPESLPNTANARIKVACADNPCVVFFTISADNFEVESDCDAPNTMISPDSFNVFELGDPGLELGLQNNLGSIITGFDGTIDSDDDEGLLVFLDGTPPECAVAGNTINYHFYSFAVDASGSYTIAHGGPFGTVLNLYSAPFTGTNCNNHIASSAERPDGMGQITVTSNLTATLEPGNLYIVMVSSFGGGFPSYPFDYNISFTSTPPGANVYDGVILPTDYSYTFIAVNSSTGIITLENEDSDFTGLPSGSYDIYGVAYYSGSGPVPAPVDPSDWIGQSLSTMLGTDCAVVSANAKPILVLPSGDCDASFEFNGVASLENPPFNTVEFCQNEPNPSPTITGNPGGEFSANNPNISINAITGLIDLSSSMPGTYVVTYEDDTEDGCDESIQVIIHSTPSASASNAGPYCVGETIQLNASGGTSYNWTGPNGFSSSLQNPSIPNATLAMAGTYSVTVTDANNCSAVATTNVGVNQNPNASASNAGPYCEGETIQLNASGGTSYSWTGPNGFNSSLQNPSIPNATLAMAGTYSVTVTNANNCSAVATTNVGVNENPIASASNAGPYCEGETIQLNASGGTSYNWTGPNGFSSSLQNPSIPNATLAMAGIYSVTVTNANNCSDIATTNVGVNQNPNALASNAGPYCEGETIQLNASGGTSYSWTGPDGFSSSLQNPSIPNATLAMAGTYSVTVTNDNNCSAVATTNVGVNENPIASASNTGPYCEGETIQLNASGGTSYSWTGHDGFSSSLQNPSIPNATLAMAGTYSVTVTNDNNCSAVATTNVGVNENPIASASNAGPYCEGETVQLNASGGTSYSWTGPDGFSSSLQNPSIPNATLAMAGTYSVTVTNANNCSDIATTNVVVNENPIASASNAGPYCEGETIQLNASGGTSYSWTGPDGFSSSLQNPSIPNASIVNSGMYSVTITDTNGCEDTGSTSVTVNPTPTATASNGGPYFEGDDIELFASGGVSYSWSGPDGFTSSNQNPVIFNSTSENAGVYVVTVTDVNGCTSTAQTSVVIDGVPEAVASNGGPYCEGEDIELFSDGGDTYSWSGPGGFTSSNQNPVIPSGTLSNAGFYTVTVTDSNGGSATASTEVIVNELPTASASNDGPYCEGETINLAASGGLIYSWEGPDGFSSTDQNPTLMNATASMHGNYSVTVTDSNGCSDEATTHVTVNENPTASASNTGPYCPGESIQLFGTGGGEYNWSGPEGFNSDEQNPVIPNATPLNTGTYTLTITDTNGCTATANTSVVVEDNEPPVISCPDDLTVSIPGGQSEGFANPDPATAVDNCDLDEIVNTYNSGGADASDLYPLGSTEVVFTATDVSGNSSSCSTVITVIEGPSTATVSGFFNRGNNEPLPGVIVNYSGDESGTQSTDSDGFFSFVVQSGASIELNPDRPTSWVEFVSTIDLINIQRHILGLELLDNPYKIIAADVNADNLVSTFDLVLLQQLIVGIQDSIAGNSSWRFIPADYEFDDPENPLAENFPEVIEYSNLSVDTTDNWIAIKTGDVTWPPSGIRMIYDSPLYLKTKEVKSDGYKHKTRLLAPDQSTKVTGYQFELHFDVGEVTIDRIDINDSDLPGISLDHFFIDNEKGLLRALWYDGGGFELDRGKVLFDIEWTSARKSGDLLSVVSVSPSGSRLTAFIAFENSPPAALRIANYADVGQEEVLLNHTVLPNPWNHAAELRIELADHKQLKIELYDASGRLVQFFEMEGTKGINSIQLDNNLPAGKMLYNIRVDEKEYRGQMIRLE